MVNEPETTTADESAAGTSAERPQEADQTRPSNGPGARPDEGGGTPSDWTDLDAYCTQLRSDHAEWADRLRTVQAQLAAMRATLGGLGAQYVALGIEEDLERLNELVLGGAAMCQSVRLGFDLERYVALFWPVSVDPRPTMMRPDAEGEYRVEIWLHIGEDGRGRIRIEGEKKLEAPLPTSREKVRRVLLGAIRAPKFVAHAGDASPSEDEPPAATPQGAAAEGAAEERGADAQASEQPVEQATPREGDPNEQAPPEEQVIPLGPAHAEPPSESQQQEKSRGRRKAKA